MDDWRFEFIEVFYPKVGWHYFLGEPDVVAHKGAEVSNFQIDNFQMDHQRSSPYIARAIPQMQGINATMLLL